MKKQPAKSPKAAPKGPKKPSKGSLESLQSYIAQQDGPMVFSSLGGEDSFSTVKGFVSTQSLALNKALQLPGIPRGRLIEISGPEHSGKSTMLDHILAETQKQGGLAILLDSEAGRDAKYSSQCGVDVSKLLLPQAASGKFLTLEDTFNFVDHTLDWQMANDPDKLLVFGIDSVANLPTREDIERGAGERKPGEGAAILKHTFRVLVQKLAMSGAILVLVNQLYTRIGYQGWGDPRTEWGGAAIPYQASLRMRLKTIGKIKTSGDEIIGQITEVNIQKNKVSGTSFAKVQVPIRHGIGIDNLYTIFDRFKAEGYIAQAGAWASLTLPNGEVVKWQHGHLGLGKLCAETPGLYEQLSEIYVGLT